MSARPPALPGYDVVGELGRGGMGVVWSGVERRSGRPVAIKVMSELLASDPDTRLRFAREVKAMRGLRHPNVVELLDDHTEGASAYLVLERLDGGSLADLLRRGRVAPERAVALVAGAARGVHAAHELGLIHRDLKPGNILLTADGTPKVADFGLVRRVDSRSLTATGVAVGTPEAMAPEQLVGGELDARLDVWALGVLLHQLLVGLGPWGAVTTATPALFEAILHAPIAPPSHALRALPGPPEPALDAALDAIVLGCLERDPALRTPSALALALALEGWLAARSGPGRGARAWREARRRRRLVQGLAGAALVSCVAVVLAVARAPAAPSTGAAPPTGAAPSTAGAPPTEAAASTEAAPSTEGQEVSAELAELRRQAQLFAAGRDPEAILLATTTAGVRVEDDHPLSVSLASAYLRRAERAAPDGGSAEADARQALRIVRAAEESSVASLVIEGRALLLVGDPGGAAASFQQALLHDPAVGRDPEVLRAATRAGVLTFEVEALADGGFFQVVVVPPGGERFVRDGRDYFAALTSTPGERPAAEAELFAEALVASARLSAALGEGPRAAAALDRAAQAAPDSPLGWLARAEWRMAHGQVDAAADDLFVATPLVESPARPRDARERAGLAILMGMFSSARPALQGELGPARQSAAQLVGGVLIHQAPSGIAAAARQLELRLRRLPAGARPDGRSLFAPTPGPPRPGGRPPPPSSEPPPLPPIAALSGGHPLTETRALLAARSGAAFRALERALAAGPDPLADEAGRGVAVFACLDGCVDLGRRSFFAPREPAPPELERRRAVVERVAAAVSPRSPLGILIRGILARIREAAGDHAGAREALRAFAASGGGDPALSAIQLFELELAAGALDEAGQAVEQLRGCTDVPAEVPDALGGVVDALRRGDDAAALDRALPPVRELLRAYRGFFDARLVPWLEERRAALGPR